MLESFFKKPIPLLKDDDVRQLREIERTAYLEEAKKLVIQRGVDKAKNDYGVKIQKEGY